MKKNIVRREREKKKDIHLHWSEQYLSIAFSTEMKETGNNGVASLKCQKKITIHSEFYELVKLSFKGKDAIKYFRKIKERTF